LTVDLAIVGAGPAGMAAAALAARLGLDTLLIDEQKGPGGQIYRAIERASPSGPLGKDYHAGRRLLSEFHESGALYRPATTVWHIDGEGRLYLAAEGRAQTVGARQILLATGAIERPAPIPGWTLPGVMTAGAAQILLKSSAIVPEGRSVLAGQGPLLYLLAVQLARAGATPAAILETTPFGNTLGAARYLRALWPGRRLLFEGLHLLSALRRAGIPIWRRVKGLSALGQQSLERVSWQGGEIAADHLFLHQGVIPNIVASRALGLAHEWDERTAAWRPAIDAWGRTNHPAIAVAGDAAGIAGAEAAALMGRLAALAAAERAGAIPMAERDRQAAPIRAALSRERAPRPFLDRLYRPPRSVLVPEEDDIVACRCEGVRVGEIRHAARLGACGANQAKAFTRCGMGACQGRICGPLVSQILADALGWPVERVAGFRPRAPWKPIALGALAALALGESAP
jgi:octopine oxidase subunit A